MEKLCLQNIFLRDLVVLPRCIEELQLNNIISKPIGCFDISELVNLKKIKINYITIKEIKLPRVLTNNNFLDIEIDLSNCNLELINTIPIETRYLNLSKNKITNGTISDLIEKLNNLIELNISGNKLNCTPKLPLNISKLDISYNQIDNLDLFKFKELISLTCSNNKLIQLTYSNFLENLCAVNNQLTEIKICKYMEYIDVSHNLISKLYLTKKASRFVQVNLSFNKLTNLNLYGCEIYKLNCSNNLITKINNYENIFNINISSNPVQKITLYNYSYEFVDIRKTLINQIDIFDSDTFIKIKKFKFDKSLKNKVFYSKKEDYKYLLLNNSIKQIKQNN